MANTPAKAFVDVNVLLTAILGRTGREVAYTELKSLAGRACISTLSVHIFMHFAAKQFPLPALRRFLNDFQLVSLTQQDVAWAFANVRGTDFEDALQLATAVGAGCQEFITFDEQLHKRYLDFPQVTVRLLEG